MSSNSGQQPRLGDFHYIDFSVKVSGESIPFDHSYALFGALSKIVPEIHGNKSVGIRRISGYADGDRLWLTDKSHFVLRVPMDMVSSLIPLCGKMIQIDGDTIHAGIPSIYSLQPASEVYSPMVAIKSVPDDHFLITVEDQLRRLGISSFSVSIDVDQYGAFKRRTISVKQGKIGGYGVKISDLSEEDSMEIMSKGVGGRRRFGCGLFRGLNNASS